MFKLRSIAHRFLKANAHTASARSEPTSISLTESQLASLVPWLERSTKGHAMAASVKMSLMFGLDDRSTPSSYHVSDVGRVIIGRWEGMAKTQESMNLLIYQDGATDIEVKKLLQKTFVIKNMLTL